MLIQPESAVPPQVVEILKEDPTIELAFAFGSVARGTADVDSDLDIAVLASRTLSPRNRRLLIGRLAQASGRPVDLVDLSNADVIVVREVVRDGTRLFCRDEGRYLDLLSRMVTDAEDFLPLRERLLKARRDAWLDQS
ncbi:MAG: nucleotidyltransferase domain-containing protein [Gammaproteobacteria bacterium]|nr:nucleotidyltransferase domain-containing protein [Gammaproteobacteria bacterium]